MESELFEEMLFGDLLNEGQTDNFRAVRLPQEPLPDSPERFLKQRDELLKIVISPDKESDESNNPDIDLEEVLTPERHFFRPVFSEPRGKMEWLFRSAVEAEGCLLLSRAATLVNNSKSETDKKYKLTLALRKWHDYLVHCGELTDQRGGKQNSSIYAVLAKQLSAMLCDLSYRFRDLELSEGYSDDTIELEMGELIPGESLKPQKTPAYFTDRAIEMIRKQELNQPLIKLCETLRKKIQTGEENSAVYRTILNHLENAFFLILYRASFINRDSQKLEDETYCREWVTSVRAGILTRSSLNDFADQIQRVMKAESEMKTAFTDIYPGAVSFGRVSEAVQLIHEVQSVVKGMFSMGDGRNMIKDESAPPVKNSFTEFVRNNFITEYDMKNAFEMQDKKTVKEFIDKHDLDYAELSPRRKLYDRKQVEEILKDFKK